MNTFKCYLRDMNIKKILYIVTSFVFRVKFDPCINWGFTHDVMQTIIYLFIFSIYKLDLTQKILL